MPLYEYACQACGHALEVQQKLAEPPLRTCPACGKDELQKLISATAFVLKGSGWYKDGYSSPSRRTDNQRTDRLQKALSDDKKKSSGSSSGSSSGTGGTGGAGGSSGESSGSASGAASGGGGSSAAA